MERAGSAASPDGGGAGAASSPFFFLHTCPLHSSAPVSPLPTRRPFRPVCRAKATFPRRRSARKGGWEKKDAHRQTCKEKKRDGDSDEKKKGSKRKREKETKGAKPLIPEEPFFNKKRQNPKEAILPSGASFHFCLFFSGLPDDNLFFFAPLRHCRAEKKDLRFLAENKSACAACWRSALWRASPLLVFREKKKEGRQRALSRRVLFFSAGSPCPCLFFFKGIKKDLWRSPFGPCLVHVRAALFVFYSCFRFYCWFSFLLLVFVVVVVVIAIIVMAFEERHQRGRLLRGASWALASESRLHCRHGTVAAAQAHSARTHTPRPTCDTLKGPP